MAMWWTLWVTLVAAPVPSAGLDEALAFEARGDDDRAVAMLRSVLRKWPTWVPPRLELARIDLKLDRDLDEAEWAIESARALAPENARAQALFAQLMLERGQPAKAERAFATAIELRPELVEAEVQLGNLQLARGDALQAEMHFRSAVRAEPSMTTGWLGLVRALERQGRIVDAIAELERLHQAQPTNIGVTRRLAELYESSGRTERARSLRAQVSPPAERKTPMRQLRPSRQ